MKDYTRVDIDLFPPKRMEAIQKYMKKITGDSTVPKVFIGGTFVGGKAKIENLHK